MKKLNLTKIVRAAHCTVIALITTMFFVGCTTTGGPSPGIPVSSEMMKSRTAGTLSPGDELQVRYPRTPELDFNQRVRADGKISLPMLGDIQASGRSVSSLQRDLEGRYEGELGDARVNISVLSVAAVVYVSGEVPSPKKVPLDRPLTALEAVMEAGGPTPAADMEKIVLMRTVSGKRKTYQLDLYGAGGAVFLKPFDVIVIGQRKW